MLHGGSAVDAVEAAVRVLEDCPVLNAGRGAYPTTAGTIELDALIMDGRTLDLGAVAAVRRVRNPVSLARQVMARTSHAFLVGFGAEAFADSIGFPRCDEAELRAQPLPAAPPASGDTVGAVAVDAGGNVAAATSTGGTPGKMPGRVGDSPLPGSGAYADGRTAAVSGTGDGEAMMKLVVSRLVCQFVAGGQAPQDACRGALAALEERFPGTHAGFIAVDPAGRTGVACNTAAMPWALADASGVVRHGERPPGD